MRALDKFCEVYNLSYRSADEWTYGIIRNDKVVAYCAIEPVNEIIKKVETLSMPIRKIQKVSDKRLHPTLMWDCEDGVYFAKLREAHGELRWGRGLDDHMMAYYKRRQKAFKYIRYGRAV